MQWYICAVEWTLRDILRVRPPRYRGLEFLLSIWLKNRLPHRAGPRLAGSRW
jgi:hypothetical protein